MPHRSDLSVYNYSPTSFPLVNVGWLDAGHGFPIGRAPAGLVDALVRLAAEPWQAMRGHQGCVLCGQGFDRPLVVAHPDTGDEVMLGHAEIRCWDSIEHGYAAPTLVVHYVQEHGYRPPDGFVERVLRGTDAGVERLMRAQEVMNSYIRLAESVADVGRWLSDARPGDVWTAPAISGRMTVLGDGQIRLDTVYEHEDGSPVFPESVAVLTLEEARMVVQHSIHA